jgi:hypothetical protein
MNHTWYVTFEVPRTGTLIKRRSPRATRTFATEAEAKEFARVKFEEGLVVTAGTIIPYLPRQAIPSSSIAAWLEPAEEKPNGNPAADHDPGKPR